MQKKTNLHIFQSNINNSYKPMPFNIKSSDVGHMKYLPPVSREWKNTIYSYYKNRIKNVHMNTINLNKIIKSYFNLHFKNYKFNDSKYVSRKKRRFFLRRIYLSKLETKHTNAKTKITFYTMNIGKKFLHKKYISLSKYIRKNILSYWKFQLRKRIRKITELNNKECNLSIKENNLVFYNSLDEKINLLLYKYKLLSQSLKYSDLYLRLYLSRTIKHLYYDKLKHLRKYQYNYFINKYKFEKGIFLDKLSNIILKIFNEKPEFNIINLKSIALSPDIFTQALSLRLRRKKSSVPLGIASILNRARIPRENSIKERSRIIKSKDWSLLENKYPDLNLISIFNETNLYEKDFENIDQLIDSISNNNTNSNNVSKAVFNSIKHKNMGGIRLEVKGRLTKRYRADRAIYKLKWKGGLKNIDSSFKGLSTVVYRGFFKPSVTYGLSKSKRRIGAFAVKGWISGK